MTEAERLERVAKQMAVMALELKGMDHTDVGWQLSHLAETVMRRSMKLVEEQGQALMDKVEMDTALDI